LGTKRTNRPKTTGSSSCSIAARRWSRLGHRHSHGALVFGNLGSDKAALRWRGPPGAAGSGPQTRRGRAGPRRDRLVTDRPCRGDPTRGPGSRGEPRPRPCRARLNPFPTLPFPFHPTPPNPSLSPGRSAPRRPAATGRRASPWRSNGGWTDALRPPGGPGPRAPQESGIARGSEGTPMRARNGVGGRCFVAAHAVFRHFPSEKVPACRDSREGIQL